MTSKATQIIDQINEVDRKANSDNATCQCCEEADESTTSPVFNVYGMDYCLDCLKDRMGEEAALRIAKTFKRVRNR